MLKSIERHEGLVHAAKDASIDVPQNLRKFARHKYPYWALFCDCQIERPLLNDRSHYKNARAIAEISLDDIKKTSFNDIIGSLE